MLEPRLHEEIERAQRYGLTFSLILMDLDHFKSVNDAFGHLRGDHVMAQFAARLAGMTRKSDILFRYGGDEFLLLLPNTAKSQAVEMANRLLEGVCSEPFEGKPPLSLSISLGVVAFPEDGHSPETLFERADQRHYEAKRLGRGRVVGEESVRPPALLFDDEARLVERDDALAVLYRFLQALPDRRRGTLVVAGPPGSGRTRFLSNVGQVARLQGYEVIAFRGSPALKNRIYGDLAEICQNWTLLPSPSAGEDEFICALRLLVEEKGRTGLLFVVENLGEADWRTQELLRRLMISADLPILLGLVFSTEMGNARRVFPQIPFTELIELHPLSRAGFSVWLRTLMKWEAPADFTGWLYEQTGGLPSWLQRGLTDLAEQGVLVKGADGWMIQSGYAATPLRDRLGLQAGAPASNLPAAPTGFVGREAEIQLARELLNAGRLLTLIGPGGVGKTRLGLQLAAELMDRFNHGVCWVPLASVSSPDYLLSSIAGALGFSFYSDEAAEIQLINYLREKQILLVLDNFEHLTQGASLLSDILERAPKVKMLVTSRERLRLQGETILELCGMSFPAGKSTEYMEGYAAVQLFVQSARRSDPEFVLKPDSRAHVARICQLVDGLPLGIELASAWVRVLSCEEISQEIEGNLDFLSASLRDLPDRHRSLRAVFEHSWNLLLEEERQALRRMAVFRGGFTREAAAQVAGASIGLLSLLMDKSILRRSVTGRYELHEVLRQYAQDKLSQSAEEHSLAHARHCAYYAGLFYSRVAETPTIQQKETLVLIAGELENLRRCARWAIEQGEIGQVEKLLEILFQFYEIRGLSQEGVQILQQAEEYLHARASGPLDEQEQRVLGKIFLRRGVFAYGLSHYLESHDLLNRSLEILHKMDERKEIALALLHLSMVQTDMGSYEQSWESSEKSLALSKELGDLRGVGFAINQLGVIAYRMGEYQQSAKRLRESLNIVRETGDSLGEIYVLSNLGNVESELGEFDLAKQHYRESLALCEEIGAKSPQAGALNNLGDISCECKEYLDARKYLNQSLAIYTEIGNQRGMSIALENIGEVAYYQGQYAEARRFLEQSLQICAAHDHREQMSDTLSHLGIVACAMEDYRQAEEYFIESLEIIQSLRSAPMAMEALIGISELLSRTGQTIQAYALLAYTLNHPATMQGPRDAAEQLFAALESHLTDEEGSAARERGRLRPVEEVVNEILTKGKLGA